MTIFFPKTLRELIHIYTTILQVRLSMYQELCWFCQILACLLHSFCVFSFFQIKQHTWCTCIVVRQWNTVAIFSLTQIHTWMPTSHIFVYLHITPNKWIQSTGALPPYCHAVLASTYQVYSSSPQVTRSSLAPFQTELKRTLKEEDILIWNTARKNQNFLIHTLTQGVSQTVTPTPWLCSNICHNSHYFPQLD